MFIRVDNVRHSHVILIIMYTYLKPGKSSLRTHCVYISICVTYSVVLCQLNLENRDVLVWTFARCTLNVASDFNVLSQLLVVNVHSDVIFHNTLAFSLEPTNVKCPFKGTGSFRLVPSKVCLYGQTFPTCVAATGTGLFVLVASVPFECSLGEESFITTSVRRLFGMPQLVLPQRATISEHISTHSTILQRTDSSENTEEIHR